MSSCEIIIREDTSSLTDSLITVIEQRLEKRLNNKNPKPIGLATGRTMLPIYHQLSCRINAWPESKLKLLRDSWCSFNLDEYIGIDYCDPNSFRNYMDAYLASPLNLPEEKILIPDSTCREPRLEAFNYKKKLEELGGISFQLLGLGNNGHIGFNEPPSEAKSECRVVKLSPETIKQNSDTFLGNKNKFPLEAITLGISEILSAEEIHLVVTGADKAEIFKKFIHLPMSSKIPASWLWMHHNLFIWVDNQAISQAQIVQIDGKLIAKIIPI